MSAKVNEVLRLIEVRRSNLAFLQEDGPIKLGQNVVAKRQEMHDRMMYHGSLLVAADAASAAAGKDFKVSGEEVHPQEGLKKKDEGEKHHAAAATAAANSAVDTLSKEMEPAMITKTKESIETDSVFDASTTSFFKGYGIAAGHVEDRIGGLGLIGVYEDNNNTSDGIRRANHSVYLILLIILSSWFLFNHKIYNYK